MSPIEIDGNTVRVDDDGVPPLPQLAHWLKDVEPPKEEVGVLLSSFSLFSSAFCDVLGVAIDTVDLLIALLGLYTSNYRIAPTKYVTATSQAITLSSGSATISREW